MGDAGKERETQAIGVQKGNPLFEKAVAAIGFDDGTTRLLLVSVLRTLGAEPASLTGDDLGHVLPEIDRRLRQLVPEAQADAALKRIYRVLFDEADGA
jgi:hypothetical protein